MEIKDTTLSILYKTEKSVIQSYFVFQNASLNTKFHITPAFIPMQEKKINIVYTKQPEKVKAPEGYQLKQNTTGCMVYDRTRPPPPTGGYDRTRPSVPKGGYNRIRPSAPKGGYNRSRGGMKTVDRTRPTPNNQYFVVKKQENKQHVKK